MPLVKLTIFPESRDIPAEEIPVLRSQGLIEDEDPAEAAPDRDTGQPEDDDAPGEAGDDPEETE